MEVPKKVESYFCAVGSSTGRWLDVIHEPRVAYLAPATRRVRQYGGWIPCFWVQHHAAGVDHDFIVCHDAAHVGGDLAPHVPVALPRLVLGTILGWGGISW